MEWRVVPGLDHQIAGLDFAGAGLGYVLAVRGDVEHIACLLYTSPSPRDGLLSRMPSSA